MEKLVYDSYQGMKKKTVTIGRKPNKVKDQQVVVQGQATL